MITSSRTATTTVGRFFFTRIIVSRYCTHGRTMANNRNRTFVRAPYALCTIIIMIVTGTPGVLRSRGNVCFIVLYSVVCNSYRCCTPDRGVTFVTLLGQRICIFVLHDYENSRIRNEYVSCFHKLILTFCFTCKCISRGFFYSEYIS